MSSNSSNTESDTELDGDGISLGEQSSDMTNATYDETEIIETCIIDDHLDYIIEDDDSNIRSMVSVSMTEEETSNGDGEFIVPEVLESDQKTYDILDTSADALKNYTISDSWPTLEISPGGVIKHTEKDECVKYPETELVQDTGGLLLYSCAKCSQSFQYLFCLVKHVRWHETQTQTVINNKTYIVSKNLQDHESLNKHTPKTLTGGTSETPSSKHIRKVHKSETSILADETADRKKYICLHSNKRKPQPIVKPLYRKRPKK